MSTSLARKIRRIGLTRTFHTTHETVATKDEQGNETEGTITRTTSTPHRIQYSPKELLRIREEIASKWRAARKRNRSSHDR